MALETIEIKPKTQRNAILLAVGCLVFSLIGLLMIFTGEELSEIFAGLVVILLFGGGGAVAVPRMLQRKTTMLLTPQALEQHYPEGKSVIPWADIEKVGSISIFSNTMVGVRLKTYDNYLNKMSAPLAHYIHKNLPTLQLATQATAQLEAPDLLSLWAEAEKQEDLEESLSSFNEVKTLAQALAWVRKQYGYDFVFSWAELDRSAADFITLLEKYRSSAQG